MKIRNLFASLLLVAAFAGPAFAQDVTPEVTPEAPPVVVIEQPVDDTVSVPSWFITNSGLLFFAAGALSVLVTAAISNRSVKAALEGLDKSHKDAIEAAYEVVPEHVQEGFQRVLDIAENLTDNFMSVLTFVKEVTDGQANTAAQALDERIATVAQRELNTVLQKANEDQAVG